MALEGSTGGFPMNPEGNPPDKTKNHCPKCGSTDFRRDIESDIGNIITSILPGFPSIPGINYVCKKCGNRYARWEDLKP